MRILSTILISVSLSVAGLLFVSLDSIADEKKGKKPILKKEQHEGSRVQHREKHEGARERDRGRNDEAKARHKERRDDLREKQ